MSNRYNLALISFTSLLNMSKPAVPQDAVVSQIMEQNLHNAIDDLIDEVTNKIRILETNKNDPGHQEQLDKLHESLKELQKMKREE